MIQATSKFGIEFDDMNVIVMKRGTAGEKSKNPGEETWRVFAYYPKVSVGGFRHALDRIALEHTLASADLRAMADSIDEMHLAIANLSRLITSDDQLG